jgi:hypothetical protein
MTQQARAAPSPAVQINERAPIVLRQEIEVLAAPGIVWEVLAGIENWPTWNADVRSASLEGELAEGTSFRWKAGPSTLKSKLVRVAAPEQIAWTGTSMGLNVIHVYDLEPRDGKTLVRTAESAEGIPARLFRGPIKKRMDTALALGLGALKSEAERRAAA